ncbi:fatty acid desaturase [Alcaligenes sp. SDU_A2]|uniref:fatty acid desaturase n=1 Tax=Alcaligenes sp. SDU_A2 TaxID=3136634 RepID=UPI00311DA381
MMAWRLRNRRDVQSLAYLLAYPVLVVALWRGGFSWPLYGLLLFLTLGVGVINHNHHHLRMWSARLPNRLTDFWLTALQGHPACVFWPAHGRNHHRYKHGEQDAARTYRFRRGDTNDTLGWLMHPFEAVPALYPMIFAWLGRLRRYRPGVWRYCMAQYGVWLGCWALALALDPVKGFLYVILPQLHGLHWLLTTNYLQHAHADGRPQARQGAVLAYARNFEGLVNPLLFNIGLHVAHHEHSRAHWSALTRLHANEYRARTPAALNEGGLISYMLRVFVAGLFVPACRSQSFMSAGSSERRRDSV